jgi:NAD+ synthase
MKALVYGTPEYNAVANEIRKVAGVIHTSKFQVKPAIRNRVDYLKNFLRTTGRKAFVLGISGGVDSTTTGRLCQIAVEELRAENYDAKFIAVRLPAGVQLDEADAQAALAFIKPDHILTVNIGEAATNLSIQGVEQFTKAGGTIGKAQADFNKGNIKARLRMVAQYQIAAMYEGVVIGTDHNSEWTMSFFTRFGDEACDLTVLNGLNKRQVRLVAKELGAPEKLWNKPATADLEEENPGKLDSEGFGFEYDYLDDFLEGLEIPKEVEIKLVNHFEKTRFKRSPITGFKG